LFTGIIEELGQVVELVPGADSARVTVRGPLVTADAIPGASIAVNGVCLTVVEHTDDTFTVEAAGSIVSVEGGDRGFDTLIAGDSQEAIAVCRNHPGEIDLLVTDLGLPGVSGGELSQSARELRPGRRRRNQKQKKIKNAEWESKVKRNENKRKNIVKVIQVKIEIDGI